MYKFCQINFLILFFTFFLSGCDESPSPSPAPYSSFDFGQLSQLLDSDKLDEFYKNVAAQDISSVRQYFESQARNAKAFNYGVLVNANIITPQNTSLFKPTLKAVKQFRDVPNESRCYMNSALFNIANSEFFDSFLELDRLYPEHWKKRPSTNLAIANPILTTLREVIYEIRLGLNTSPARIAKMRARHLSTFENLESLKVAVSLHQEIFASYDFELMESLTKNERGEKIHNLISFGTLPSLKYDDIKAIVEKARLKGNYSALGSISSSCVTGAGNVDFIYLDAIFSVIDPWGRSVRYLSAAIVENGLPDNFNTVDSYGKEAVLKIAAKPSGYEVRVFHNGLNFTNDIRNIPRFPVRILRNLTTKSVMGAVSYQANLAQDDGSFTLIAKSKVSSNHVISELYRYAQNLWEKHNFFGEPTFSKVLSTYNDGSYTDFLYFFARN